MLLSFLGINRLFLRFVRACIVARKFNSLEEFIAVYFQNYNDPRIIIYYDGKWQTNPNLDKIIQNILVNCEAARKVPNLKEILSQTHKVLDDISVMSKIQTITTQLQDGRLTRYHLTYLDAIKPQYSQNFTALQTSYKTAVLKNFYEKEIIVNQYRGNQKISTLLLQNKADLIPTSEIKTIPTLNIAHGSWSYGYNQDLLAYPLQHHATEIGNQYDVFTRLTENIPITTDEKRLIFNAYLWETHNLLP